MNDAPRFIHDCDNCIFLGQFNDYDLYVCPMGHKTVIGRFGSNGPNYTSGLEGAKHIPVLIEAKRRAVAQGLLKKDDNG